MAETETKRRRSIEEILGAPSPSGAEPPRRRRSIQEIVGSYRVDVRPGDSPDRPLNEQHPELSTWQRFKLKTLGSTNPEGTLRTLEGWGYEARFSPEGEPVLRKKGTREPWRKIEATGITSL